jgi:enoyl-CoA hydratase
MEALTVTYHRQNKAGIITLNRPHRLNAINMELLNDFKKQIDTAMRDDSVQTVILTGEGRAFCAGEDLKETAAGKDLDQWIKEAEGLQSIQRGMMDLGKPIIAAVAGYAVGGGCEFAMGCDMRIAAESAVFGFPETGVGLTVTNAGTKLLTHLVGLGKAKELIFTGEFIEAHEALRIGLVNKVVPDEDLLAAAMAMAETLSHRSPLALRLSKIAIDQGISASFEQVMALETSHLLTCAQSETALVEKRLAQMKKPSSKPAKTDSRKKKI